MARCSSGSQRPSPCCPSCSPAPGRGFSWGAWLLSPYGPIDIVVGSLATLLAALLTQKTNRPWLAPLPPVVCNMVLVGGMLAWYEVGFSDQFLPLFAANALWVGIGQAVSCYGLGLPLLRALRKVSYFRRFIPEDRRGLRPAA